MYGDWFCTIYVQCLSNLHILRYRISLSRTPKPTLETHTVPEPVARGASRGGRRRTARRPGARGTAHLSIEPFNSIPSLNMCCECDVRAESARVREDE